MAADGGMPPEMTADLKKAMADAQQAAVAIREVKSDNDATKKNLEGVLIKFEDLKSGFDKQYAAYQKVLDEQKEKLAEAEKKAMESGKDAKAASDRVKDLELKIVQNGQSYDDGDDSKEAKIQRKRKHPDRQLPGYKGVFDYLRKGIQPQGQDPLAFRHDLEAKTLRTDVDTGAGYLIPQVMDNEIRKDITEISPVRAFARVRQAPSKTMDIPRRLALLIALYEGEGEDLPAATTQSTYGTEQVTLFRQTVSVPATLDMMVSSAFDLEREIASDVGESFGKGEALNFIKGSGTKCPQGIIVDPRPQVVTTAVSAVMDFNDIANLIGTLKRGQMPWLFLNRRTLAQMWQIKSTIGVPIWQPVAGALPATIWGFPYNSDMIDLDDAQNGSNAKPVVFADLRRGYEIFDMMGISVIRDDLTLKKKAITEWTFRRYNTGRVIMPEAIKILKIQ
jgi:HK97 family phage major capsid protein